MDQVIVDTKIEFNLQSRCVLKIAQQLWNGIAAKREIRIFFQNPRESVKSRTEPCSIGWPNLMKRILAPIEMFPCPGKFKRLIRYEAHSLGLQIYEWINCVKKDLKFNVKYAFDIYYTPDGKIDRKRIFQQWLNFTPIATHRLFNIACLFCLEDCIRYLWHEMPVEMKRLPYYERSIYRSFRRFLIAYWISVLNDSQLDGLDRTNFLMDKVQQNIVLRGKDAFVLFRTLPIEENMFRVGIFVKNECAVKYFGDKLSVAQRKEHLIFAFGEVTEQKSGIVLYLTSIMTLEKILQLILKNNNVFKILLSNSQGEELFMTIIDSSLQFFAEYRDSNACNLKLFNWLSQIVSMMRYEFITFDSSLEAGRYQRIFQEIWKKLPMSSKNWVIESYNWMLLLKLIDLEDFSSLQLLINDTDLSDARKKIIITRVKLMLRKCDDRKKVYMLDKFADQVGLDDKEKDKLRIDFFCD